MHAERREVPRLASRQNFEKLAKEALFKAFYSDLPVGERLKFISTVDEYFRVSEGVPESENEAFYRMLEEKVREF